MFELKNWKVWTLESLELGTWEIILKTQFFSFWFSHFSLILIVFNLKFIFDFD